MKYFLIITFTLFIKVSNGQAFFRSAINGNWNSTTSWTLVSGSSTLNYPTAGDSVIIQNGDSITVVSNSQCQSLTVKGASTLLLTVNTSILTITNDLLVTESSFATMDAGSLTITGNLTINQRATVTQNGGAFSVIGLGFLNSPSTSAGNTILLIDAGLFSCFGGMTITATTLPTGRFAELKIGNSAVNVVGALTTISANAKITFTGIGALTLAGIITIPNATSFTAGNGRVVYVGIPGANQNIAALTYNRLVITGVGNGSKTISGNVIVTDTLALLTDTLLINGSGTLKLNNNATIVKTAGKILSTPTYLGQIDILYNDVQRDTTGLEMPVATNVLRNLFINNIAGVKLGNNVTINNKLSLQNGELFTDNFTLNINNALGGTTTDPAIERTNGFVNGKINRAIGTSTGIRIFPFGVGLINGYREFKIEYTTAPSVAGTLNAQHFNVAAASQSGLPLADGSVILTNTAPYYWQADALAGLSSGTYNTTLTAESTSGVTNISTLQIVKRPSTGGNWTLNGTAGTNTGTNTAPVVVRNGMSNFSQFTIAGNTSNPLPLTLLDFTGKLENKTVLLQWKTTNEMNTFFFSIEKCTDGFDFVEIGKVFAANNSASENNYSYKDANTCTGKYFYRLKMIDKDGKFDYSNIISFSNNNISEIAVYPTLCHTNINISMVKNQAIFLYNANGKFIKNMNVGFNDISNLANGMYFIKTTNSIIKIMKQ
jgi:hypothetical protein